MLNKRQVGCFAPVVPNVAGIPNAVRFRHSEDHPGHFAPVKGECVAATSETGVGKAEQGSYPWPPHLAFYAQRLSGSTIFADYRTQALSITREQNPTRVVLINLRNRYGVRFGVPHEGYDCGLHGIRKASAFFIPKVCDVSH